MIVNSRELLATVNSREFLATGNSREFLATANSCELLATVNSREFQIFSGKFLPNFILNFLPEVEKNSDEDKEIAARYPTRHGVTIFSFGFVSDSAYVERREQKCYSPSKSRKLIPPTVNTKKFHSIREFSRQFLPVTVSSFKVITKCNQPTILLFCNNQDTCFASWFPVFSWSY